MPGCGFEGMSPTSALFFLAVTFGSLTSCPIKWYHIKCDTGRASQTGLHRAVPTDDGVLCATVIQSCLLLLGNSLLFSDHPLNSSTPQYSPDSHLCGPFSFPGRKAQNNDGSSPLASHSPGITHTPWQQIATNMAFACHLHPSSGSSSPSSPSSPHPSAGLGPQPTWGRH